MNSRISNMRKTYWILASTETNRSAESVFVIEIAAQKMFGWEPEGLPFRKLLSHKGDIFPAASRGHCYTREMLERDGENPIEAYDAFRTFVGGMPLVGYNADYDLEQALKPEWKRLGLSSMGSQGFCAMRLVQRLLDPLPVSNCKLQTLLQYYNLPSGDENKPLGRLQMMADMYSHVLHPVAEDRGLYAWDSLVAYAREEWFPSRFLFGKFKGRSFFEARENAEMRQWLDWLAASNNEGTAQMGRWYLGEISKGFKPESTPIASSHGYVEFTGTTAALVVHENPDIPRFRQLVAAARARLAELEASYIPDKAKVSALQARLFKRLRPYYEKRDSLRLVVNFRRIFLTTLLRQGEEDAKKVAEEFREAKTNSSREYQAAESTMNSKRQISSDDQVELKKLWKKLVLLFHPDRFMDDPERLETYTKLTAAINTAKDNGDIETLRKIADDPTGFVLRKGWTAIQFGDSNEVVQLRKLWESLEAEILKVLEAVNALKESPDWELLQLVSSNSDFFENIVEAQTEKINSEVEALTEESVKLADEICLLSGDSELEIN